MISSLIRYRPIFFQKKILNRIRRPFFSSLPFHYPFLLLNLIWNFCQKQSFLDYDCGQLVKNLVSRSVAQSIRLLCDNSQANGLLWSIQRLGLLDSIWVVVIDSTELGREHDWRSGSTWVFSGLAYRVWLEAN